MRLLIHALTLGALCAVGRADSVVVFNEIHYHPAEGATEWLELHNQLAVDVDLSAWSLAGGISYRFPAGTILTAGGWLVLAGNPTGMPGALGPWTGKLNNSGETIELRNNSGRVMDTISYGTEGDWPTAADGGGVTLAKRGANLNSGEPLSWQASRQAGGTPGNDNFPLAVLPPVTTLRVATGEAWKYRATAADPGPTWNTASYNDTAWATGSGTFQLGFDPLPSPAAAGTALPSGPTTYYFRRHFAFPGVAATTTLLLRLLADDGTAVYLNGSELARTNLATTAGYATTALIPHRAPPRFQDYQVPAAALLTGDNVLAVELHQAAVLPDYPAAMIAAGPVAYWRLGESSNPVSDLAELAGAPEAGPQDGAFAGFAAANPATAGPRPADSVGGNFLTGFEGANFAPFFQGNNDGGNDVARFPDDGNLTFAAAKKFSFEAWVKGNPTQEGGSAILAKGTGGGEQFACDTVSNQYRFFVRDANGSAFVAQSGVAPNNTWQHLVGICDTTQNLLRLYVNGVQVTSATAPTSLLATTHDVSIGARQNTGTSDYTLNFNGLVDEVAVYNRALTPAEITAHYNAAFAASSGGPDLSDAVFAMDLSTVEVQLVAPPPSLVLNEIGGASGAFGVELMNTGALPLTLPGAVLARLDSAGYRQDFLIGGQTIPAGGLLAFDAAALGWSVASGDRILLFAADGTPLDARVVKSSARARQPNGTGPWMRSPALTLGTSNNIPLHQEIVINEIMYDPPAPPLPAATAGSQWIELYNTSTTPVDLSGWTLNGAVDYTFPAGTTLATGGFLVIAGNPAGLTGVAALGPWSGSLGGSSDAIELQDAAGNPADQVRYFSGGHWPEFADGGGSSLERRDPRASPNAAENWAASDESTTAQWQTFTWRGPADPAISGEPTLWNELDLCLLDGPGELLLDDVRVTDTTTGQQLIQNGDFSAGMAHWRATGTHRLTQTGTEPNNPVNQVLHVIATGAGEYQGNQIESTFLNNTALVTGRAYEISLRARWLAGGGRLNTRLYFNRLARTNTLAVAPRGGTPGHANSRASANLGPTYSNLCHSPVVPDAGQAVTVSVAAADPDGIAQLTLKYAVAGGAWQNVTMTSADGHHFAAAIPGQAAGSITQFHVQGTDALAAVSTCPAAGAASRALYVVQDGQAATGSPHKFRLVMTALDAAFMHADLNALSNASLGATIIADEGTAYYDVGVRLKGSFVGRNVPRVGFNVRFQPDHLFRGVHDKVAIDRSAGIDLGVKEIIAKHIASHAGGIPNMYDDIARFVHVLASYNSGCMVRLTGYEDEYLSTQYPNGDAGMMYEYEVMRSNNITADGTPEGIKLPGAGFAAKPDIKDLGNDQEAYRWVWLLANHRAADDFSSPIAVGKLFSLTGTAFDTESRARLDVDQWLRSLAYQTLIGPSDTIYLQGNANPHNIRFFTSPTDARMHYMPWDWDGCFTLAANAALTGSGNVAKLVTVTAHNQRVYLNHIHDLISTTFNTTYMSRWTQHYGAVNGEDFSPVLSYIGARAAYALTQLPTTTAFSAAAGTVSANGAVTLTGQANIMLASIEVNGMVYAPAWASNTTWQIVVPLASGMNTLVLRGLDAQGLAVAGSGATLMVNNPNASGWPGIRINEWMASNTTLADPADGNKDDWFELHNSTGAAVDLTNWALSDAPAVPRLSVIPAGTVIPAGGALLVWADNTPAQSTPGGALHVAFKLSGDGETLTLSAPDGRVVDQVSFGTQTANFSEGSYPDSGAGIHPLSTPTPGTANVLLRVVGVTAVTGQTQFTFTTTPGHRYRVEGSMDLLAWLPLAGTITATGPTFSWTEPATEPRKFYRALLVP